MFKLVVIAACLLILQVPNVVLAQDKASDFFKNLSGEKNLLDALYSKSREKAQKDATLKPFTLAGEVGLLNTSGNTDTSIAKLAIESNHEMTNWSNRYETEFLRHSNTIREVTDNIELESRRVEIETTRIEISAQFDYKLVDPHKRLFSYIEYDDNEFNNLRNQKTLVMGWSQVAWKEDKSEFRYSIGPGYSHIEQQRDDLTIEEMIVRGTVFYNLEFGSNARFRQTLSAELGEIITKARSQSSISANIFGKLAMKFSLNIVFNENVAQQDSQLSTQTSITMVYQFL